MLGRRYRVVERLGRGGMADVYRAEDVVLRRPVAIKIFRGGVEREQHLARFRAEVRTLAALTHPHLVALYDAGGDITEPWCAMEYVNGGSLADRDAPLPPADVARIGEQIAAGLQYVHERGIVHRDVKPSNVLLDAHGDAFLSDFGIAKLVDGTRMTQSGLMIGTAAFLSPEQVRGLSAGPASDVYALGLVLLEALTGHREYPGTPVESAVARLTRPPEVPAALDADWGDLIRSMTAEVAEDRPTPRQVALRLRAMARRLTGVASFAPTPDPDDRADDRADDHAGDPGDEPDLVSGPPEIMAAAGDPPSAPSAAAEPAGGGSPAVVRPVTPSLPIIALPVAEEPRNLLGWLSPERRRRAVATLVGAGAVVAVVAVLPLVDGGRAGEGAVRVAGAAAAEPTGSTGAGSVAVAGDGTFGLRKAPVEVPPSTERDRAAGREPVRQVARPPRAVAGVATTRSSSRTTTPPASPSPTPSPTPSPSPSTTTTSPSSPSSSAGTTSPSTSTSPTDGSPSSGTSSGPSSVPPTTPAPTLSGSFSGTGGGTDGSSSGGGPSSGIAPFGVVELTGSGSGRAD